MKTVVITGGSRGIGAAAVERFAARGYQVYFLYEKNHAAAEAVTNAQILLLQQFRGDPSRFRDKARTRRGCFGGMRLFSAARLSPSRADGRG